MTTQNRKGTVIPLKVQIQSYKKEVSLLKKENERIRLKYESKCKKLSVKNNKLKVLSVEVSRLRRRSFKWKSLFKQLKEQYNGTHVKGHSYSLELMYLAVLFNINFNISLRATASAISEVGKMLGKNVKKPCASTIRNWSNRLGMHFLKSKLDAGNYALIIDESISTGKEQLLVLLATKLSEDFVGIQPLEMSDVRVVHIESKESWKGCDIKEIIEKVERKNGLKFQYTISDQATNLKNAINLAKMPWVSDCTHVLANTTQTIFEKCDTLNSFVKEMNLTRAKWVMSKNRIYLPPGLRKKARFHQIFVVQKWGWLILSKWNELPEEVKNELAYVKENKELLSTMLQMHTLIETFSAQVKGKGVHHQSLAQWDAYFLKQQDKWRLEEAIIDPRIEVFNQAIKNYITQIMVVSEKIQDRVICCSDVIESMFGKYKNKGANFIITDDSLKIAAFSHQIKMKDVQDAFESISMKQVLEWKRDYTTVSSLVKKRNFRKKSVA